MASQPVYKGISCRIRVCACLPLHWSACAQVKKLKPDNFTPKIIKQTSDYLYVEYESPLLGVSPGGDAKQRSKRGYALTRGTKGGLQRWAQCPKKTTGHLHEAFSGARSRSLSPEPGHHHR